MKPTVYMMLGLPGSGKSTFSKQLAKELGLRRLSVDEEYSNIGGDLSDSKWDKTLATKAAENIKSQTKLLVKQGKSVVLDLCPWVKSRRDDYRKYIESIGADCKIYYLKVGQDELNKRLAIRNKSTEDAFIVTPELLKEFTKEFDEPIYEEVETIEAN